MINGSPSQLVQFIVTIHGTNSNINSSSNITGSLPQIIPNISNSSTSYHVIIGSSN